MRKPLLFAAAMFAFPGRVLASEPPLFDSAPLDDEELASARGGFTLPGGVQIDFGAVLTTSVDGVRELQTTLQLTDSGLVPTSVQTRDGAVEIKGGSVSVGGGQATAGVTITPGANGGASSASFSATVEQADLLIRHLVDNQISSVIVNTADSRVIENELTINLRLDNVAPLSLGSLGLRLDGLAMDAASFRGP